MSIAVEDGRFLLTANQLRNRIPTGIPINGKSCVPSEGNL